MAKKDTTSEAVATLETQQTELRRRLAEAEAARDSTAVLDVDRMTQATARLYALQQALQQTAAQLVDARREAAAAAAQARQAETEARVAAARQAETEALRAVKDATAALLDSLEVLGVAQQAVSAAGGFPAPGPAAGLYNVCKTATDWWERQDPAYAAAGRAAYLAGLRDDVALARQRLKDAQALPGDRSGIRDATIRRCWYSVRSRERILTRALGQDFSELSSEEEDHQIRQACAGMVWQAPSIADVEKSLRGGVSRILKGV